MCCLFPLSTLPPLHVPLPPPLRLLGSNSKLLGGEDVSLEEGVLALQAVDGVLVLLT